VENLPESGNRINATEKLVFWDSTGTTFAAGERIGVVGQSGVTYGMHLFFEVLVGGRPVDPAPYPALSACK